MNSPGTGGETTIEVVDSPVDHKIFAFATVGKLPTSRVIESPSQLLTGDGIGFKSGSIIVTDVKAVSTQPKVVSLVISHKLVTVLSTVITGVDSPVLHK